MSINRSLLFKTAWRNARAAAAAYGIPLRRAFASALREAWALLKRTAAPKVDLAVATTSLAAELRQRVASGERFGATRAWRFQNAIEGRGPVYR